MGFGQLKIAVLLALLFGAFCEAGERIVAPDVLELGRIENSKITESGPFLLCLDGQKIRK